MKKYAFFKYFIKNRVFTGGGGAGTPVPIGGGVGCLIFTFEWCGGRCMEAGVGTGMLKSAPLPCLSTRKYCPFCSFGPQINFDEVNVDVAATCVIF